MGRRIALYLRVSKAERNRQSSGSIERQRQLLRDWVAMQAVDNENAVLTEYIDDGSSGMSERRAGYERMLAGVLLGKIDVVLVKDFSRLSRDYLVLARLREETFPMCGVRLVALGDAYDSAYTEGGLGLDFRSLFYEYYCHDISRKVKGALQAKKEHGEYAAASVPFGYRSINGAWQVQPEEADILRFLFGEIAAGKTYRQAGESVGMEAARVWYLVHNPVYLGWHVWHRYENHLGRVQRTAPLSREHWQMQAGAHEAIVDEELYAQVQSRRSAGNRSGRRQVRRARHIFSGITKCGHCGRALSRGRRRRELLCCLHCSGREEERICLAELLEICRESIRQQFLAKDLGEEFATLTADYEMGSGDRNNTEEKLRLLLRELWDKIEVDTRGVVRLWWNFKNVPESYEM